MKPHIYRYAGRWYCRRDHNNWNQPIRQCGIAADSPAEAYQRAADHHQWEARP